MDGDGGGGGGGGGQKMHELVIREPAEQSKRGKRRRRDNEVEMKVEEDVADGVDAAGVSEPSSKFRPGTRGGVVFGEDGTISTVRTCLPDAYVAALRARRPAYFAAPIADVGALMHVRCVCSPWTEESSCCRRWHGRGGRVLRLGSRLYTRLLLGSSWRQCLPYHARLRNFAREALW